MQILIYFVNNYTFFNRYLGYETGLCNYEQNILKFALIYVNNTNLTDLPCGLPHKSIISRRLKNSKAVFQAEAKREWSMTTLF